MAGVNRVEGECFPDPYPSMLLDDLIKNERGRFFVAVDDGKIIGYAVGTSDGQDAHIVSVAVGPGHRRRGIGTALLSAVMQSFMKEKVRETRLEVRKGNTAAVSFYERMGFRRSSEIKRYYADGEDAWVLRRPAESPWASTR